MRRTPGEDRGDARVEVGPGGLCVGRDEAVRGLKETGDAQGVRREFDRAVR
jgi:hypothetical protein